jgi:cell division septation protein DedD
MRIVSTIVFAEILTLAFTTTASAQAPGEDSGRSRAVSQTGTPSTDPSPSLGDSLFRRAERLVREGRGEIGRALVDTLLARTRPGSAEHAQALYWRASLAGDAADAERGYRRVIVEYPATHWAGDALLNLAQLELARGDQERAVVHLHRFEREHPSHESRARAAYWLARLHFERKNEPRGCAALATARVAVSLDDVELRNQIDYYAQRCIGVDTAVATLPRSVAAASATATTPPDGPSGPPRNAAGRDSQHPAPTPDSAAREAVDRGGYTVQVAAFDTRVGAEVLIGRLKARGYMARLASSTRPFRVRIGRYDTRADAVAALHRLKAKGIDGFVTETERP